MKRKLILFYSARCGKCHAINKRVERLKKEDLFPLEYEKPTKTERISYKNGSNKS